MDFEEDIKFTINKCKRIIDLMLGLQQWSGLSQADIDRWLQNFENVSTQEMIFVYKVLINIIYYNEKDIISTLRDGINYELFNKTLLTNQINNNFSLSQQILRNIIKSELKNTCFIPLSVCNSPHESGNYISRLLVQQQIISSSQSFFHQNLPENVTRCNYKRVVIVDDCVGTGEQFRNFWDWDAMVRYNDKDILLKEFCLQTKIECHYLFLFGYEQTLEEFKSYKNEIEIHCLRILKDANRVFSENNYIWDNVEELDIASKFFMDICKESNICFKGFNDLDFALIMHQTIPDWSLPLFWSESPDWKPLLRRKNFHV